MSENTDNRDTEYKSAALQDKKHKQNKEYDKALESFERSMPCRFLSYTDAQQRPHKPHKRSGQLRPDK